MDKKEKKRLQRAIVEIEKPYPEDDMILTYKDVVKYRNVLSLYRFNQAVFENLIKICDENWKTEKRINRLGLLLLIKQWYRNSFGTSLKEFQQMTPAQINIHHSLESKKKIFKLFQNTVEESRFLSPKQISEAQRLCNRMIINMIFTNTEEKWLCEHAHLSIRIVNRILRYPIISDTLTQWAKDNFFNDEIRSRRIELTSRILDQNPYFEIDPQTLIDDFETITQKDLISIEKHHQAIIEQQVEDEALYVIYPYLKIVREELKKEYPDQYTPQIKLSKQSYQQPYVQSELYPFKIPDFKRLKFYFYETLPIFHMKTMIDAISFSRIDASLKGELLKKYYHPDTYELLLRRCKKQKISETLKWIERM